MYIYQIFVKIGLVLILIWQACFGSISAAVCSPRLHGVSRLL